MPIGFIENCGQIVDMNGRPVPTVLFKTSSQAADVYITSTGISYVFKNSIEDHSRAETPMSSEGSDVLKDNGFQRSEELKKNLVKWRRTDMVL